MTLTNASKAWQGVNVHAGPGALLTVGVCVWQTSPSAVYDRVSAA